jgi:uncharacterized membrane protein YfcA
VQLNISRVIFLFFAAAIAGTLNAVAGGGTFVSFPSLLATGVPAVQANATNTVALWPGLAASAGAYLKRLNVPRRLLLPLLLTSVVGGLAGSLLLLKTPQHIFSRLVPWLLLGGTLLFAFGNKIRTVAWKAQVVDDWHEMSWQMMAMASMMQLLVAIYGGYFGAGIGFMILGILAIVGIRDIHAMGAIRTLLSVVINAAAVLIFIAAGAVFWLHCLVMIAGATAGGWFGAQYTQKADPQKVRGVVIHHWPGQPLLLRDHGASLRSRRHDR